MSFNLAAWYQTQPEEELWKDASADEEMHGEVVYFAAKELLRRGHREEMVKRGWNVAWINNLTLNED